MRLKLIAAIAASAAFFPASPAAAQSVSGQALKKAIWGPAAFNGESQFSLYRELGVDLYQTQLRWDRVATARPRNPGSPSDPAYQWPASLERVISEARSHGIQVLILISGAPKWANGGKEFNYAPRNVRDFARFASAAARKYPTVRHWMIWGEPNRNFQPLPQQKIGERISGSRAAPIRRYARLLDETYGQLKRRSRRNIVIGGNSFVTGDIRTMNWVRNLRLPNGRPPRMDLYGHNPFAARPLDLCQGPGPEDIVDFSDTGRLINAVNRYLARPRRKRTIPIFMSEFGVPTDSTDQTFSFSFPRDEAAQRLRLAFSIARGLREVWGLGYYQLRDVPAGAGESQPRSTVGLIDASGTRKPTFDVFKSAPTRRVRARPRCAPRRR